MYVKDTNYVHKHFRLEQRKLRTLKRFLGCQTETEVLNRLMDEALYQREMQRVKERIKGKGRFKDVFVSSGY